MKSLSHLKVVTSSVISSSTRTQITKKFNMMHMEKHTCIKHKFINRNPNRFSYSNNVVELREFNTILCLQFLAKLNYMPMICWFFKMRVHFLKIWLQF